MTAPRSDIKIIKNKEASSAIKLSIAVALTLAVVKVITAMVTHSMAIMASALDSLLDVASSSLNLFASGKAAKPPDENHAYGHEKIESLASLFQSLFIGASGLWLIAESTKRLIRGSFVAEIPLGVGIMVFSMLLTFMLTWRLKTVETCSKSLIISTETLHYTMDILTNGGTIAALLLVRLTHAVIWDLVLSILIALYIFKTAYGILRRAADELLDHSLPPVSKEDIEHLIRTHHPSIVSFHNFRSRRVGEQIFMDFHIEIRGEENFKKAHDLTEALIKRIQDRYPGSDITVHYDPEGAI
jgi:ferrous-iron efflux pump FieF